MESEGKVTIALARGQVVSRLATTSGKSPEGNGVAMLSCTQGGTPMERVKRKESDTWKVVDSAHEAGFILTLVLHILYRQYFWF